LYQIKAREFAIKQHDKNKPKLTRAELQAKQRAEMAEKQRLVQIRAAELEAQGVQWAQFKAMKEFMSKEMAEAKKKKLQQSSIEGSAASIAAQLEDMETGDLPMVKLGDASIAAPFTSKMPSIRSCVDIVRQGRCTLVSSIQMVSLCTTPGSTIDWRQSHLIFPPSLSCSTKFWLSIASSVPTRCQCCILMVSSMATLK
jgi:cation-transporting ATPase 13A1